MDETNSKVRETLPDRECWTHFWEEPEPLATLPRANPGLAALHPRSDTAAVPGGRAVPVPVLGRSSEPF